MRTKSEIEAEIALCQKKLEVAYNQGWSSNAEVWRQKIMELQKEANCPRLVIVDSKTDRNTRNEKHQR